MREGHDVATPSRVRSEDAVETDERMARGRDECTESRQKLNWAHRPVRLLAARVLDAIRDSPIREVVFTDSIPVPPAKWLDKFKVISVAPLLGEGIQRIHTGASVGSMFREGKGLI